MVRTLPIASGAGSKGAEEVRDRINLPYRIIKHLHSSDHVSQVILVCSVPEGGTINHYNHTKKVIMDKSGQLRCFQFTRFLFEKVLSRYQCRGYHVDSSESGLFFLAGETSGL
jgi:hypothetical protein